jgi:hypothetical protein
VRVARKRDGKALNVDWLGGGGGGEGERRNDDGRTLTVRAGIEAMPQLSIVSFGSLPTPRMSASENVSHVVVAANGQPPAAAASAEKGPALGGAAPGGSARITGQREARRLKFASAKLRLCVVVGVVVGVVRDVCRGV